MTFRILLEYDAEAKAFSAVCPELPGCASAGDTEEEARRNITEAIELNLKAIRYRTSARRQDYRGHGWVSGERTQWIPGSFDLR
jgi:predicted RNase H-like HicB family nuclease